jgi:hypothetical protein
MEKKFSPEMSRLVEICRLNDCVFVAIFGSAARGEATDESDIDLLVRFSEAKSLLDLARLERELSEAVGRKVDLLTEASISPYLRDRIRSEMVILYAAA